VLLQSVGCDGGADRPKDVAAFGHESQPFGQRRGCRCCPGSARSSSAEFSRASGFPRMALVPLVSASTTRGSGHRSTRHRPTPECRICAKITGPGCSGVNYRRTGLDAVTGRCTSSRFPVRRPTATKLVVAGISERATHGVAAGYFSCSRAAVRKMAPRRWVNSAWVVTSVVNQSSWLPSASFFSASTTDSSAAW